jgi:putative membrane protein
LEFKKGAFFKVEKTIPLENIQDLTFVENPILNLLELKILKIETAGGSNQHGSDMQLIGIIDSEQFKKKVLNQRDLLSLGSPNLQADIESGSNEKILIEIRDLLKEIKEQGQN